MYFIVNIQHTLYLVLVSKSGYHLLFAYSRFLDIGKSGPLMEFVSPKNVDFSNYLVNNYGNCFYFKNWKFSGSPAHMKIMWI